jgi:hypothetical protein
VWYEDGARFRQYVRRSEVEEVSRACDEYRALQSRLRAGRAEYKNSLRRLREALSILSGAGEAGWL